MDELIRQQKNEEACRYIDKLLASRGLVYQGAVNSGNMLVDGLVNYKIPYIKSHYQNYITSVIAKNFTILLNGNINIVDSLEIIKNSTRNVFIQEHLEKAILEIKNGNLISTSLNDELIFNPAFINMLAIGESSENLVEILESATEYYDSKINYSVDKILQYLQPLIIVLISLFVAFIVFAIAIPIFDLSNGISIE